MNKINAEYKQKAIEMKCLYFNFRIL